MENIVDNSNVSQVFNEEQPNNTNNVDLDFLLGEEPEQSEFAEGNEQQQDIEIDERFKELDPQEARYRTIQSKHDKLLADYNKLNAEYTVLQDKASMYDELVQNPDLLVAFVNEINPNLIQKSDSSLFIKDRIKEEFGEGYKPTLSRDEAEREDPGGKDWRYYKRLDQLYIEQNSKINKATSVKEYKEQLEKQKKEEEAKNQMELANLKKQFNMADEEVKSMLQFYNQLTPTQAVKLFRFVQRQPKTKSNLNIISGSPNNGMSPQYQQFMNDLNRK